MKTTVFLLIILLISTLHISKQAKLQYELFPYDPVANPKATVIEGKARFTVLTDQIIRMEFDEIKQFEDRPSLAFVNRNLPVPLFNQTKVGNIVTITTSKLNLTYDTTKNFASLQIQGIGSESLDFKGSWKFKQVDSGNLYGTIRSLDDYEPKTLNCSFQPFVHEESQHCSYGVISKDGWVVVDDTDNFVLGANDWWVGQVRGLHDLYFFGHGRNYKKALSDFTQVAGVVPLVPRYSLGIWWTRWFDYDIRNLKNTIQNFKKYSLPVDLLVLDMNWHLKNSWGGYTFDTNLFPNVTNALQWITQSNGLALSLNIHDDDGVQVYDDKFLDMCKAMGVDPNSTSKLTFASCASQKYSNNLEDVVLQPLEKQGVDVWWIDWQQGGNKGGCQGLKLNPTIWLNKVRVTDEKRRNPTAANKDLKRKINLARWGGLGNHRYQIGFSADVPLLSWQNLALQPYFSATAANVAFGYWSHDITAMGNNMEMYLRWIQWGSYSGIMRFHERGLSSGICATITFPDPAGGQAYKECAEWTPFDAPYKTIDLIREALNQRINLLPYLYTEAKKYQETGVAFLRPLYYDYPEEDNSYKALDIKGEMSQYMYGDQMMVAPIVQKIDEKVSQLVNKTIWIPPGNWIEEYSGQLVAGNQMLTKGWDISEIPIFIKAGSIIPKRPKSQNFRLVTAKNDFSQLQFDIYASQKTSQSISYTVYEDDGKTQAYLDKQFTLINASYVQDDNSGNLTISSSTPSEWKQSKKQNAGQREFTVRLINQFPPTKITYQTKTKQIEVEVKYQRLENGDRNVWNYIGTHLAVEIKLEAIQETDLPVIVKITANNANNAKLNGLRGAINHAQLAKENLDQARMTPVTLNLQYRNLTISDSDASLNVVSSYGERLAGTASPDTQDKFLQLVNSFGQTFKQAIQTIKAITFSSPEVQDNNNSDNGLSPQQIERIKYSLDLMNASNVSQDDDLQQQQNNLIFDK